MREAVRAITKATQSVRGRRTRGEHKQTKGGVMIGGTHGGRERGKEGGREKVRSFSCSEPIGSRIVVPSTTSLLTENIQVDTQLITVMVK